MVVEACPACGVTSVHEQLEVREMMFGLDAHFPYAACSACASLRLLDIPTDLSPFYPQDYYSIDLDPETALGKIGNRQVATLVARSRVLGRNQLAGVARRVIKQRQFQTFTTILQSVRMAGLARGRGSAVLDVGCGSGMLVYALGLAGIRTAVGVDPFAPGDRTFDNGATLLRRDLHEVEGEFDLVMFHHSFEHVMDPRQSLLDAQSLLRPGGRILIRMPTVSSDAFDTYRDKWVQLDAPRHITIFSREGMEMLAAQTGLTVMATVDDSTSFQFWGSEQVRLGTPLESPTSHMINTDRSAFSREQIRSWEDQAEALNARSRGDQAVWVLAPA